MKELPEDVNSFYENEAINRYKSKNLLAGLKDIRKNRTYTGKDPGAMLVNTKKFKILCYVEAHDGVVITRKINKFVVHKSIAKNMVGIWNDSETEFVIPESKRNPLVEFYVPKEIKQKKKEVKVWDAIEEEKVEKVEKENKIDEFNRLTQ